MAVINKTIIFTLILVVEVSNVAVDVLGIQPQQRAPSAATTNTLFPVLFESPRVLVVRKPHGIGHHDETSTSHSMTSEEVVDELTTLGALSVIRKERQQQVEETGERLYGIHRLDKVTSGILVLAKDATTASTLSDYFAQGKIQKVYFGLSAKKAQKKKQGIVQGGMVRSRNKSWKLVRKPKNDQDRKAVNFAKTRFFTTGLKSSGIDNAESNNEPITNVKTVAMFRPYTGKTHQLRVAAKSMGIPLLGDSIYRDGSSGEDTMLARTRTMLHASGIHIPEFLDQAEINVWCPPTFFHDGDGDDGEEMRITDEMDNDERRRTSSLSCSFDMAVRKLMMKHCDVPGILETMLVQQQDQHV